MLPTVNILGLFYLSLAVFGITLTVTKSRLLACKRKFVQERYDNAKANGEASFLHEIWRALWLCPMCLGFYVSAILCYIYPVNNWLLDTLVVYGLNWLWHCAESSLFWTGKAYSDGSEIKNEEEN